MDGKLEDHDQEMASPSFTLRTPAPVSSLAFGQSQQLFVGSDDGSLRQYNLPSTKVVKAIRGLGSEISSITWLARPGAESGDIWLACGTKIMLFHMDDHKIILDISDAASSMNLGERDEDVLNEISLSPKNKFLAFSSDGGTVGVVDLSTKHVTRMKTRHESICGSVKFIPDRPNELLSGGYDSALLHFDFIQGAILSRLDLVGPPPSDAVSLSPPFIHSISLAPSGTLAASTADGRIWFGHGGEKRALPGNKKKRSRKWEGLTFEEGMFTKVAEGPVVAVMFNDSSRLTACTLLGKIVHYALHDGSWIVTWETHVKQSTKVNSMQTQGDLIAVGGFDTGGKGVVEVFHIPQTGSDS